MRPPILRERGQGVAGSSFDAKQRVREAVDIVDVASSYLQLRRDGQRFKALCPWHDDTRPSLQINPLRQSFKCWVCDIGGDVFSFVMKMEGVAFPEALSMLAERAGIRLDPSGHSSKASASADDKQVLYKAMSWAVEEFHRCLLDNPAAEAARQYILDRSIDQVSVESFRLGFSPDSWDWILNRAGQNSVSPRVLERIGLVIPKKGGPGFYDRFKGRVLFPIFDAQNRAVGFGGRVLPGAPPDTAKYVNSPETLLFTKSKLLYGLNKSRDAIRKMGTALVMEGYTDCIAAHQFGFSHAVAVLGTALGTPQIRLLNSLGDNVRIVLVLDGDEAGRRRATEVLSLFVAEDADLRVLTLPNDMDPCEFLLERGAAAFQLLIDGAIDALSHAIETATRGVDLERDVHRASQALEDLVSTIAKAPRPATRQGHLREEKFLSRLAARFRVPEESLRDHLRQSRQKPARHVAKAPRTTPQRIALDPCEAELLEILIQAPHLIGHVGDVVPSSQIASAPLRMIYQQCQTLAAQAVEADFARLLLEFDDAEVKNLLVELDERSNAKGVADLEARLEEVLAAFERRGQEQRWLQQSAALKDPTLKEDESLAILRQIQAQERARQGISWPTDG